MEQKKPISGETISGEEMLRSIREAGPILLKHASDENVKSLLKSAIAISAVSGIAGSETCGRLVGSSLEAMVGASVAANLILAANSVWHMTYCSSENAKQKQLKAKYVKFAAFIDQIQSETKNKYDTIRVWTEKVKQRVAVMDDVKKDEWKTFFEKMWISVNMIQMETAECVNSISFALKKIQEFQLSIKDADDRDKMGTIISNVATVVTSAGYALACPPAGIPAGVITVGSMIYSLLSYQNRSSERDDLKTNLTMKSSDFEKMLSELDGGAPTVENCLKMAKQFRETVSPFS